MRKFYFLMIIFLLCFSNVFSGTKYYGINLSFNYLKHSTYAGLCQKEFVREEQYNSGLSLGGFIEYPVMKELITLQVKLTYDYLPMSHEFLSTPTTTDNILIKGIPLVYGDDVYSKYYATSNYSLLSGEFIFKASFSEVSKKFSKLNLLFGPSLGYTFQKNFHLEHRIYAPQTAIFEPSPTYELTDNNKTKIITNSEIPDLNALRLSVNFGLEYNINFTNFQLSPYITYNTALNNVVNSSENSWGLEYWRFGIDLTFKNQNNKLKQ